MGSLSRIIFAAGLALSCNSAFAGQAADSVSLSDPYARAVPPGQPNGVVFLRLVNGSEDDHALVGARSDAAKDVEIHTHLMEDGMMRMRQVERIELPPSNTVSLEPGGLHLMLIGLTRQLEPDQQIQLDLIYEDGSRTQVAVPVRKVETGVGGNDKERKCGSGRCGSGRCGGEK